jgi:uncharacterized membrane protein YraQ (UPF0718 family)
MPSQAASARRFPMPELLAVVVVGAALLRPAVDGFLQSAALRSWTTIFVAIVVQALPFLVFGVVLSGAIAAFVPARWLSNMLPKDARLAVPVAGLAGMALPGCECGAVPVAGRLVARGAPPAAALTFLLSAPAINPVVLVSTSVAFPTRPAMVAARFVASLATSVVVGLIWSRVGKDEWIAKARRHVPTAEGRVAVFAETAHHDFLHAGGFLVVGGLTAATLQTVVPRSILDSLGSSGVLAVVVMATLAVVLAICSEADAFVAAGMFQFSLTARLVFLVVGPTVDIKLIALQAGTFGRDFAVRFAPLTFVVAIACSLVVGRILL